MCRRGAIASFQCRSFRFALEILAFHRKLLTNPNVPRHVAYQLCRAGIAIGANLEEAKAAYSRRDLAARYTIGLREARECLYWLRLLTADQPETGRDTEPLIEAADQLVAVLTATVRKLRDAPDACRASPTSRT